jgi:hypothetical protein
MSFMTEYLQFDGGYRFFTMEHNFGWLASFKDGFYGRLMIKRPFDLFGLLEGTTVVSLAVERKAGYEFRVGFGFMFGGNICHNFLELGGSEEDGTAMGYVLHVNLRANSQ